MARVCAAASKQLVWTATWHMREETFALALARLVEAQNKAPLATVFGTGTTSSSDGQHFFLGGPGEASGTVNPHRGLCVVFKLAEVAVLAGGPWGRKSRGENRAPGSTSATRADRTSLSIGIRWLSPLGIQPSDERSD